MLTDCFNLKLTGNFIDFDLFYHLNGEIFDVSDILTSIVPKDSNDLTSIINEFDKIKVCHGYAIDNEYQLLKTTFDLNKCIESFGRFRHTNCTKIVIDEKG